MKYTFRPTATKPTHTRKSDNAPGILREHDDSVTIRPAAAQVDPADFEAIALPAEPVNLAPARFAKAQELYEGGKAATLTIFSQLPLGVQAQFRPVLDASDDAARNGNIATAKEIIETCVVPSELASTQAALAAALDPFVLRAAALGAATTLEEIDAV